MQLRGPTRNLKTLTRVRTFSLLAQLIDPVQLLGEFIAHAHELAVRHIVLDALDHLVIPVQAPHIAVMRLTPQTLAQLLVQAASTAAAIKELHHDGGKSIEPRPPRDEWRIMRLSKCPRGANCTENPPLNGRDQVIRSRTLPVCVPESKYSWAAAASWSGNVLSVWMLI